MSTDHKISRYYEDEINYYYIQNIVIWIIISISLPLTVMALYFLVQDKNIQTYVINLFISDVIQLCCLVIVTADPKQEIVLVCLMIYWYAEMTSINFMVCVAFERYLAIAHPLWYRFSRSVKINAVVCVVVWLLSVVLAVPMFFLYEEGIAVIMSATFHLLPFPCFIFFLVGAVRALSAAIHLNSVEKRRIIGTLVLPILTYSMLFTPFIIRHFVEEIISMKITIIIFICISLSPLANVILYVFIRRGFLDKLLVSLCCKMDENENNTSETAL
ncbi:mas-related G-protein coupled receptor member X4-like [Sphaeramia orbicularis]|uniref:mas-related G-protein coupled receptor member X4-like n=1 Tax=Sphaeramia orbicularis TaxID=375764 RepID=UPI00117F92FE|nr:mas-related G-protein coupled receptor member X4-like [Sphaeramia orbicularis]